MMSDNSMPDLLHYAIDMRNKYYYSEGLKFPRRLCNSISMRFKLHKYRMDAGLTQAQVAEAIGISQGLYNQLESGKRRMNETYLSLLADLYQVSPVQLIVDEAKDDPLYSELDAAFRQLSPLERQIVVDSAKGIAAARAKNSKPL